MKNLIKNLALHFSKMYLSLTRKSEIVSFPEVFRASQTVLIMLPFQKEDVQVACNMLERFQIILRLKTVYICVHESLASLVPHNWEKRTITYSDKCITLLYRPRQSFLKKIKAVGIDFIINLYPDFDLFSSNLAILSNAKLRVCLYNEQGDYFFNLQINDQQSHVLEQKYASMLKYINFMTGTPDATLEKANLSSR